MPETENSRHVECDVCGLEIEINRKRDWQLVQKLTLNVRSDIIFRKHIFEDLRPYQCLETSCQSASETYSTCTKLLKHMKEQHPNSELLTVKELACPFCQEELPQKKQQRFKHVGGHMEEIALSAITGAFEEDWKFYSDSEKYLSSVCSQKPQQHKNPVGFKDLPSARSGLASAAEAPIVGQAEIKASSAMPRQAFAGHSSGQEGAHEMMDPSTNPDEEDKTRQRPEARPTRYADLAKVSAPSTAAKPNVLDTPSPSRFDEDPTADDLSRSSSRHQPSHTANGSDDFIRKLNKMLEEPSYYTIVRRGEDGHSVVVLEKEKFAKSILPVHFKHSSFRSFVRQLNKYGFHRVFRDKEGATLIYGQNALAFRSSSVSPAGDSHRVVRRTKKFARPSAVLLGAAAQIDSEVKREREVTHQFVDNDPPILLKTSQPIPKVKDVKAIHEVVDTSKDPHNTIAEARHTENPAKHREVLRGNNTASPKPTADSTKKPQQTSRGQPKKDRPRLERTGAASSWDSWTVFPTPRKAKKPSVPSVGPYF